MKNVRCLCVVLGVLVSGLLPPAVHSDLVVDVDSSTPGVQSSLAVLSGSSVTVLTLFDPTLSGPLAFNGVGLDLNWTGLGLGVATPTSSPLMGSLGSAPGVVDIVSGAPLSAFSPMTSAGLPPLGAFSVGGVGFVHVPGTVFGIGGPIGFSVILMGVTYTITGSVGDSVTFTPSGILLPPVGSSPVAGPFVPGGHPYQAAPAGPTTSIPEAFVFGGTVTIVPEPRAAAFFAIGLALLSMLRRPERAGSSRGS